MKVDKILQCKNCGDQHHFKYPGEFWMCKCNSIGYDVGHTGYSRFIGKLDLFNWIKK